ncbi:alanine racemase [Clostridium sp. DSM 8431]|uniref:alanine racemase n=1 Tax=Clostridium sp. DSM 8431 TaxID=1761781 RepID=UPI0008E107D4|nr:alanine racemase [Clostridium sp. DSM 8431]SFU59147.1 alanine racemase [Clostridium sp. DSM 8431]
MDKVMRSVWAEIDLDAVKFNIENIKKISKDRDVVAVVKADAYGHGAVDMVPTLLENGASRLAVAMISEALELRKNGIKAPIMILGYTPLEYGKELIENDIEQTVYDLDYVKELSKIAKSLGKKSKIHIAIDTGMGRIGFLPGKKTVDIIEKIVNLEGIDTIGMFTHFATADELDKTYTYEQFDKMNSVVEGLKERDIEIPFKHVSNSGAIMDMPETFLEGVRAGIILYGYYPSDEVKKDVLPLKKVLTLKTRVSHVKELDEDMYISYGRTFKTSKKSVIATIPVGYADGYSRLLSGKAKVIINGKLAPVVGRICMDQCMVDITDIGGVKLGDEVILLGEENGIKYDADDMARDMGTINYEIICMLKQRIPRVYIKKGEIVKVRNYI